jgi:hypothetical protein
LIRIPEGKDDREIMRLVESFPLCFADIGLRISTGPVVLFRATEHLLADAADKTAVPLLHAHNGKARKAHCHRVLRRFLAIAGSDKELRPFEAFQFQGREATTDRWLPPQD